MAIPEGRAILVEGKGLLLTNRGDAKLELERGLDLLEKNEGRPKDEEKTTATQEEEALIRNLILYIHLLLPVLNLSRLKAGVATPAATTRAGKAPKPLVPVLTVTGEDRVQQRQSSPLNV
jgi:hypothetical protein